MFIIYVNMQLINHDLIQGLQCTLSAFNKLGFIQSEAYKRIINEV